MNLGDTFTMATPPKYAVPHLYFVISDKKAHGGIYVIVNITSDEIRAGRECVLDPADHAWIKKESFVSFSDALVIDSVQDVNLRTLIGKLVTPQETCPSQTLEKIITAAKASISMPKKHKRYLSP